jgi:phage FluMu protein Com
MNIRCTYCGTSFGVGRDVIEGVVAQAGGDKNYALQCPRCRKINKIPIDRLRRTLPPGWTATVPSDAGEANGQQAAAPDSEPATEQTEPADQEPAGGTASKRAPARKRTAAKSSASTQKSAGKTTAKATKTGAKTSAKKTSRKQAKP